MKHVRASLMAATLALMVPHPVAAADSPFDLVGPELHVAVTRDGRTLSIDRVPDLAPGDRLSIRLGLPPGQRARYRLILGFLNGATDRPPERWFHDARTWKDRGNDLSVIVPEGAQQAVLFLMPEQGGDLDAVIDAVRRRPGTFVRAAQELGRASLDRARLDAFLRHVQAIDARAPARVADASRALTRSLSLKLDLDCLAQPADRQTACLAQGRESMLLVDNHSSTLVSTLTGAPTDLAFQLSATPQAGYGYYSPYIGVVRDIFRIFGAFQSTQLQYIPALTRMGADRVSLLLNAPVSFGRPTSVVVAGLPAIEPPKPPPVRIVGDAVSCAADTMVLPLEGAPLIHATGYARNWSFRLTLADGRVVAVPARADAERGGLVPLGPFPIDAMGTTMAARVHGDWGFRSFEGPAFTLGNPVADDWAMAGEVRAGQTAIALTGGAASCVTRIDLRASDGTVRPLEWRRVGDQRVEATLSDPQGGRGAALLVHHVGSATPTALPLATPPPSPPIAIERLSLSHRAPDGAGAGALTLSAPNDVPHDAALVFAFRALGGIRLNGGETVEIASDNATARLTAGKGYDLQDASTGVARFVPADALGPLADGPLRFRVVQGDRRSTWTPLATAVRLPRITEIDCPPTGDCALVGERLFLIDEIGGHAGSAGAVAVPDGFTAPRFVFPRQAGDTLQLRLRSGSTATLRIPPPDPVQ